MFREKIKPYPAKPSRALGGKNNKAFIFILIILEVDRNQVK